MEWPLHCHVCGLSDVQEYIKTLSSCQEHGNTNQINKYYSVNLF